MTLTTDQQRIYNWFQSEAEVLEQRANDGDGKLPQDQAWAHEYFRYPYLLLASDEYVIQRFSDVFNKAFDSPDDLCRILNKVIKE